MELEPDLVAGVGRRGSPDLLGVGLLGARRRLPRPYVGRGGGNIRRVIAHRATRLDRDRVGTGLTLHVVPEGDRELPALDDSQLRDLVALGHRIAALLGQPQDIELVIAAGTIWILRARPITVLDS